jgi:putative flavoprotein involved in K+ transport
VVVERGEVANTWRTQRWDALRLLTPNWLSRLPGFAYHGDDPDGFMMPEIIEFIDQYASSVAPRCDRNDCDRRAPSRGRLPHTTDEGVEALTVMLASGGFNFRTFRPAADVPHSVEVAPPLDYRRPAQLPTVVSRGRRLGDGDPARG